MSIVKYPNLAMEKRFWQKGYLRVAGLDEAGRGCERPDAEVLTDNGWKIYKKVDPTRDRVLSYSKSGNILWQRINRVVENDFNDCLIELKNRGIHTVVTPNHNFTVIRRVFVRNRNDKVLRLVGYASRERQKSVNELVANDYIPRGGRWAGSYQKVFKIPAIDDCCAQPIEIKKWVAFLGIFLSEGSIACERKRGSYKVIISQSRKSSSQKFNKIYELLSNSPFKFRAFENGFVCYNKQLFQYLFEFKGAHHKFIPYEIKQLPSSLLNILIDWMMIGDGGRYQGENREEVRVYYTVSKRLRDDFEEVALKAGWTFHTTERQPRDHRIKGRIIKKENQFVCFEIRLRRNNKAQVKSIHKRMVSYRGKVFCLQLSRHHNFYVRRSGTGYFTGNSLAGPVVAAALVVKDHSLKLQRLPAVRDSKQLTPRQRERLYRAIVKNPALEWGIGVVSEKIIDRINILEATKLAMVKALRQIRADCLILDGKMELAVSLPQRSIVKADVKVFSCAAASILAKVTRDRLMAGKYHRRYPRYRFEIHKGYPSPLHLARLKRHGSCPIHRQSFGPVENLAKRRFSC